MTRRRRLVITVVIVGVIAVYFVRFMQQNNWYQPRITQAQVRQEIRRGLPMGSTVPRTIAFLKGIGAETDTSTYPNHSAQSTDGFEQQDPSGSTLTAAFPNAYPGILVSGGIYMKYGFNAKGRLTRYDLRDIYTGL